VHTTGTTSTVQGGLDTTGNFTVVGTVNGRNLSTDGAKLDGIATGATKNQTDTYLRSRANHTGSQAISTITGLQTALDGKASTSHHHDERYATQTALTTLETAFDTHHHDATYSPLGHTHDDRYYTESEVDTKLAGKANTSHTHSEYASTSHTHDNRYYTESEVDTKLDTKASAAHTHDDRYALKSASGVMIDDLASDVETLE